MSDFRRRQSKKRGQAMELAANFTKRMKSDRNVKKVEEVDGQVLYDWYEPELQGWPVETPVKDILNFLQSGVPARFLFLHEGEWQDFPVGITEIRRAFSERRACIRLRIHGEPYLVSFVHMMLLSLCSGSLSSVAWIDRLNRCFFPSRSYKGDATRFLAQLSEHVASTPPQNDTTNDTASDCSTSDQDDSEISDESESKFDYNNSSLNPHSAEFRAITSKFLSGMGGLSPSTTVLNISCTTHPMAIRKKSASSNLRFGWYATSKQVAAKIATHGFKSEQKGVYLAPVNRSRASAVLSEADSWGRRCILLCQVITGSAPPHSKQELPSAGNDHLSNPNLHLVWTPLANTHILPLYILTFKLSTTLDEVKGIYRCSKEANEAISSLVSCPNPLSVANREEDGFARDNEGQMCSKKTSAVAHSPWMSFSMLFQALQKKRPSSDTISLKQHLKDFQARQISREELIATFRRFIGDDLLVEIISRLQTLQKYSPDGMGKPAS